MNFNTTIPRYKIQPNTNKVQSPMVGWTYSGDSGNSEWHTGMLIQIDGDEATLVDARGKKHVIILSTLRNTHNED